MSNWGFICNIFKNEIIYVQNYSSHCVILYLMAKLARTVEGSWLMKAATR